MNQHTPGPWTATCEPEGPSTLLRGYRVTADGGLERPGVVAELFPRPYPVAVCEANARLIAASPELLAALESLLAAWDAVGDACQIPDELNDDGRWEAARAAVLKVRGTS